MSVSHVSQDEPTRADVWTVLKELPQRVEALLKHHEASQELDSSSTVGNQNLL